MYIHMSIQNTEIYNCTEYIQYKNEHINFNKRLLHCIDERCGTPRIKLKIKQLNSKLSMHKPSFLKRE